MTQINTQINVINKYVLHEVQRYFWPCSCWGVH